MSDTESDLIERIVSAMREQPKRRALLLDALGPDFFVRRDEFHELVQELREARIASDERFAEEAAASKAHSDELRKDMLERFAASDKRFAEEAAASKAHSDKLRKDMHERFAVSDKRFAEQVAAIEKRHLVTQSQLSRVSSIYGKHAEDAVRKLLIQVLSAEGIDTARIEHVQLKDEDGVAGPAGYITDIDIYYKGKQT